MGVLTHYQGQKYAKTCKTNLLSTTSHQIIYSVISRQQVLIPAQLIQILVKLSLADNKLFYTIYKFMAKRKTEKNKCPFLFFILHFTNLKASNYIYIKKNHKPLHHVTIVISWRHDRSGHVIVVQTRRLPVSVWRHTAARTPQPSPGEIPMQRVQNGGSNVCEPVYFIF